MRWNDFYGGIKTKDGIRGANEVVIGQHMIYQANMAGINLIIRAHQDSGYNTKLIPKNNDPKANRSEPMVDIDTYGKVNHVECSGETHSVFVEKRNKKLSRLLINTTNKSDIFEEMLPVLTISTNTERLRDLCKDSYAMIVYDNIKPMMKCYNKKKEKVVTHYGASDISSNISSLRSYGIINPSVEYDFLTMSNNKNKEIPEFKSISLHDPENNETTDVVVNPLNISSLKGVYKGITSDNMVTGEYYDKYIKYHIKNSK